MSSIHPLSMASPYIRIAHDFHTEENMRIGPTRIVDHALHYFKEGDGVYTVGNRPTTIKAGSLFLIRPGVPFSFSASPGTRFHMYNLHFDLIEQEDSAAITFPYPKQGEPQRVPLPCCLPDEQEMPVSGLPSSVPLVETATYEQLFFRILQRFGQPNTIALLQSKSAMLELLALLLRQTENQHASSTSDGTYETHLSHAVAFIQSRLHEPISLDDIAKAAQMSKSYLLKCFRNIYRLSPIKFVMKQRIERAKCELLYTSKPIKTIAGETGFDSIHSFYHTFQREVGTSPGAYRALAHSTALQQEEPE
ncbi:AraC family transcriptional regulator [Paenibacillus mendelii]|uniref:Helix-turn-helix domain-containing protein n=1 Tax=Paenibacillus mendelii TaxID=206163 RepID=A0ABV6JF35_9BACL|nr:AraC family transcriptional regulator [Paenibacillus mendelii]MCQ6557391.1 AraC family transcriptional regulator [Paenibacillus mendelii]